MGKGPADTTSQTHDKPVAQEAKDHKTDAAQKLHDDAHAKPQDKSLDKPADKPAETKLDQTREALLKNAEQSFDHTQNSLFFAKQITDYVTAKKPMTDKVTVQDANGAERTITVADHIKELKVQIAKEANSAVAITREMKPDLINQMMSETITRRNTQARELGLDPKHLDSTAVLQEINKTSDAGRKEKLQQLFETNQQVEKVKAIENAPAAALLNFANLKGGGYTNPDVPVERMANGRLKSDQKDVLDAMGMIMEAGKNKDLRNNENYTRAVNQVLPRLETGSDRAGAINENLQKAIEAGQKGDKAEQERLLRDNVKKADEMNIAGLAQLMRDPKFTKLQNEKVLEELTGTVTTASVSRLKLAELLTEQGKFGEAQKLTMRVKAELPEVMYSANPDGSLRYNESPIIDLKKLDQNVSRSSTFNPDQLSADLAQYQRKLQQFTGQGLGDDDRTTKQKEQDNAKLAGELQKLEDSMKGQLAKQMQDLADAKKGLGEEKQRVNGELLKLEKDPSITDESKQIKKQALDRELEIIKNQEELLDREGKANNRNQNVVRMLEASLDLSKEDRSAARANLEAIKKDDPEFWNANAKAFEEMSKAAEEPGWWDKWGRKAAIIAGCVAGAALAVAFAPVAIAGGTALLAGAGLSGTALTVGGGLLGTAAVTAGGAMAGATIVGGTRGIAELTGGRKTSTETWTQDLQAGANAGGSSALMVSGFGLSARVAAAMRGAQAVEASAGLLPTVARSAKALVSLPGIATIGGTTAIGTGLDAATGQDISWQSVATHAAIQAGGFVAPFASAKPMSLFATEGGMTAKQAMWAGKQWLGAETLLQGVSGYQAYKARSEYGADANDYLRNQNDIYSLVAGPAKFDPTASLYQAGRVSERAKEFMPVKSSSQIFDMVQSGGKTVVTSDKSVLTDAEEIARARDAQQ